MNQQREFEETSEKGLDLSPSLGKLNQANIGNTVKH